ncbi:MAG: hypothetical protein A2234_01850 [Elusimicrobia bacterium RIFOXYA2_FULL_58_8]|nr:MAG: hypothetical protein A2285_08700 [Elusimicrobia bacterium RIFOXYA12_FULL_57_11]OGS12564.1 MAG: hypothetical protein A2234_01850 [Elusimicrobia bacterium RIFOXYA2_FULL_58_8]
MGLCLLLAAAALYIFTTHNGEGSSFPRSSREFITAAKAQRRLVEINSLLGADPANMRLLAESGRLKYQLGPEFYIEAISDLERARALGFAEVSSFYYLGSMYQAVGLYEFAAQEYRKFLNNSPQDLEARLLLAKLCYSSGDFPCAVREYETLREKLPSDVVVLENLALARWKNKQDYAAALLKLRESGAPGLFLADYAEGRISYELKDYVKAAAFLRKAADGPASAAAGFPDRAALLWLAGDAAYRNKETDAAYGYLRELVALKPEHGEGKILLAKIEKIRKAAEKSKAQSAAKRGGAPK